MDTLGRTCLFKVILERRDSSYEKCPQECGSPDRRKFRSDLKINCYNIKLIGAIDNMFISNVKG